MSLSPTPPSVGRIVHFHRKGQEPQAAIISKVHAADSVVSLHVFDPEGGVKMIDAVGYGASPDRGFGWSWPPKA